ncbi:MAG: TldD/PmbA family protein [Rhodospirillales bacterium]|nr:TldD/PmbA family protein [Rhodospirillales bacterium]
MTDSQTKDQAEALGLLEDLIGRAKKAGADGCDAVFIKGVSLSKSVRLGKPEHLERSEGRDIGLRVFVGKRQAIVSSSDTSPDALQELSERALSMARAVPEDPYCGLAEPGQLATEIPDLESCDTFEPDADHLSDLASRAEDAALAVSGVTNSEGGSAGWGTYTVAIAGSNGFAHAYANSSHSLSASVIAGEGTKMERDYDYTAAVFAADMESPEAIGKSAGEKAIRRLNPKKVETASVPIIYDTRVSKSLVGHLSSAINGSSIARGSSFLKDKMGEQIFPKGINIVDDPHRKRGLKSRPFDGEGITTTRSHLIEDGQLKTWILDLRSARQLGLQTTGHASRGTSSPPSPSASNLYLEPGEVSLEELMADIGQGLYVNELIGFGINGVTGDYSRGASGFWIEDGKIAFPVSEVTIAGNLNDMFANLSAANDLEFRYGTDAPSVRVEGMTVAGV